MSAETAPAKSETSREVVILGGRYTVKSPCSADFVDRTASLVNDKLNDIIREGGVISTDKVAILACLNLASELLKLEEDFKNIREKTTKRLEKLVGTLGTCLSQEELSYLTDVNQAPGRLE
jgi:cell division protein ZapA (FtsZ GTPase activity inhibitor)